MKAICLREIRSFLSSVLDRYEHCTFINPEAERLLGWSLGPQTVWPGHPAWHLRRLCPLIRPLLNRLKNEGKKPLSLIAARRCQRRKTG